jgi:uncharacterized membrane protein required for colicin V production
MVPLFDVFIIVILLLFILWGAVVGIVGMVGNLLGFVAGIILGSKYYLILADFVNKIFPKFNDQLVNVISFIVVLAIISKLVSMAVNLIFKVISIIPFAKTINKLIGGFVGLIGGILIAGAVVFMLSRYPFTPWIKEALLLSQLSPTLLLFFKPLTLLLPEVLKEIKSLL